MRKNVKKWQTLFPHCYHCETANSVVLVPALELTRRASYKRGYMFETYIAVNQYCRCRYCHEEVHYANPPSL